MKNRITYRFLLVLVITLFGYLSVVAVTTGSIRVGRVAREEIRREADPMKFWTFTVGTFVITAAAGIALVQSTMGKPDGN